MTRLDTDRHYDGGDLKGELSERDFAELERQLNRDEASASLNEALICVTLARQSLADSARHARPPFDLPKFSAQCEAADGLDKVETLLRKAGGRE